jgi:hypothetical protein
MSASPTSPIRGQAHPAASCTSVVKPRSGLVEYQVRIFQSAQPNIGGDAMAKTTTNHGVQSMNYHVCGSNSDVESCNREVCLTPGNRHQWSLDQLPFRARSGSEADAINLGRDQPWRIGLEYDRAASLVERRSL